MEDRNQYWRQMYLELEEQMKNMMHMTLELVENYQGDGKGKKYEEIINENKKLKKEVHRLHLLEHRFKVTILGRITLKYIALKRKIKLLIMRK